MLSGRRILDLMKLLTIQNEENMTSAVDNTGLAKWLFSSSINIRF